MGLVDGWEGREGKRSEWKGWIFVLNVTKELQPVDSHIFCTAGNVKSNLTFGVIHSDVFGTTS